MAHDDRCHALTLWFAAQAPFLWLKPSADTKTWVLDIFGRPQGPGSEIVEKVVSISYQCTLSFIFLVHFFPVFFVSTSYLGAGG